MLTKEQTEFMRTAIQMAEINIHNGNGGPFGAVIVKNNNIIAATGNTVAKTCDPTAHAEIAAIRLACQQLQSISLEGCEIYASCEPCPMCLSAIYWARIDKIYYGATKEDASITGFDDSFIYREIILSPDQRSIPTEQIMHKEAMVSFEYWKEKQANDKF